jgi:nucleotide-binding universal stress UspA family protein
MTTQAHILVPVDGSVAAKRAIAYAAALAGRLDARISFAHVQAPVGSIVELRASDADGAAMMAAVAADYPDAAPMPKIVVGGDIACSICAAFPGAILVVGSEHASRGVSGTQSVAEALVREAHDHPILVVGPASETASFAGPLVLALDGSKVAEVASLAALAWSRLFDVPIHLVQVVSTAAAAASVAPAPSGYLQSVRAAMMVGGLEAHCFTVVDDDPVAGLLRHVDEHHCSLVVMSTHARRGVEREAMGSVTMGVIASSPCPVCAVHPDSHVQRELAAGSSSEHAQLAPRSTP